MPKEAVIYIWSWREHYRKIHFYCLKDFWKYDWWLLGVARETMTFPEISYSCMVQIQEKSEVWVTSPQTPSDMSVVCDGLIKPSLNSSKTMICLKVCLLIPCHVSRSYKTYCPVMDFQWGLNWLQSTPLFLVFHESSWSLMNIFLEIKHIFFSRSLRNCMPGNATLLTIRLSKILPKIMDLPKHTQPVVLS